MKQIFALTSAVLAVEFTNKYSVENIIDILTLVGHRTGVTFDKFEETYKLTGQWFNVVEAYDIIMDISQANIVENIHQYSDWKLSRNFLHHLNQSLDTSDSQSTAGESELSKTHQFHTYGTKESASVAKIELDEEDNTLLQPSNESTTYFTVVQNSEDKASRRKSMPCKLQFKTFDNNESLYSDVQQESLAVKKKRKSLPVKLTVKNKRGRKKKVKNEIFECSECSYAGKSMYRLRKHIQRKHSDHSLRFHCSQCSKSYGVASDLTRHIKTAHETPLFVCEICNKSFKSSRGYEGHLQLHKDNYVKPFFPCASCEKTYGSKVALSHHVKNEHLGGLKHPFLCALCGQNFTNKVSYEGHLNVHAGLRPYVCKVCGKSFASRGGIWSHNRTHDETCRYSCETCGKAFRQVNTLKVHRKIHLEIRNHFCSICGKAFTQKQALVRHERVHSGVKPFECVLCQKRFYDTSIIRRHIIFMHKKEPEQWKDSMHTHVKLLER